MSNNRKADRVRARLAKEFPNLIVTAYVSDDKRDFVLRAICDDLPELLVREWLPIELDGNMLFRIAEDRISSEIMKVHKTRKRDKEWAEEIDAHKNLR